MENFSGGSDHVLRRWRGLTRYQQGPVLQLESGCCPYMGNDRNEPSGDNSRWHRRCPRNPFQCAPPPVGGRHRGVFNQAGRHGACSTERPNSRVQGRECAGLTCFGIHGVPPRKPNCRMHQRPGPLIRCIQHSRASELVLLELLSAYRPLRPTKPVQGWLNTFGDQFLSATTREWSLLGRTEIPREDRLCKESVFPSES